MYIIAIILFTIPAIGCIWEDWSSVECLAN